MQISITEYKLIYVVRCRSTNKALEIKDFVVDREIDLLGVTETWLHEEGDDLIIGSLCPTGYGFIHVPRRNGTGGGVGLLYRHGVKVRLRTCEHSFRSFEYMETNFTNVIDVRVIIIDRQVMDYHLSFSWMNFQPYWKNLLCALMNC